MDPAETSINKQKRYGQVYVVKSGKRRGKSLRREIIIVNVFGTYVLKFFYVFTHLKMLLCCAYCFIVCNLFIQKDTGSVFLSYESKPGVHICQFGPNGIMN